MKKTRLLSGLLCLISISTLADPPTPPPGKVWVLNELMSDEFGPEGPNLDVWNVYGHDRSWDRTSAFDPKVLGVEKEPGTDNYILTLNPIWYYEDEVWTHPSTGRTYQFSGAALDTKHRETYGYYEIRIRPSDFPFGSGVFMNSRGNPAIACDDRYASELDLIENMGYTGPGAGEFDSRGGFFNYVQHVNSHTKNIMTSDGSGNCILSDNPWQSAGADHYDLEDRHAFFTVGMWWKDEKTAHFYNNDRQFSTITPARDYNIPMVLILSMETYTTKKDDENNAGNPKPAEWMWDEEFRTKDQRAVKYDWVRAWKLVDIDANQINDTKDNLQAPSTTIDTYQGRNIEATLIYSVKANRKVVAKLLSPVGDELDRQEFNVTKGVRSLRTNLKVGDEVAVASNYKVRFEILDGTNVLVDDETLVNVQATTYTKQLSSDLYPTSLEPRQSSYQIPVEYETDEESTINIELKKPDGTSVGIFTADVDKGKGVSRVNVSLDPVLDAGDDYVLKTYMHRKGMDESDPMAVSIGDVNVDLTEGAWGDISINSTTSSINMDDTTVRVDYTYSALENGVLEISFIDPDGKIVATKRHIERYGERTLSRDIIWDKQDLTPSDDYKVTISYTYDDNLYPALKDTVYNISVLNDVTDISNFNSEEVNSLLSYPNPTNGEISLSLKNNSDRVLAVSLFDFSGSRVDLPYTLSEDNEIKCDLSVYSPGVYVIEVATDRKVYSFKVIRE
ncbi:T9SS type A sorting domain-containing protein [Reichenbachiella versicolor]|uniref:T9SS type A sorting domain-containing protein n=1 Tax=Reichenbachiella versicolor TaxID=1821036 RepID=UPI0013A56C70|nr:T9SS type A sorting domain-containing protein [Reichenbachiella versicolor]